MSLTKNLGTVRALHIGTVAPTNTAMLWYDTNGGVNIHKYYNTVSGTWVQVAAAIQVDTTLFDTWRTKVRSVGITDPSTIISLQDGDRFIVGAGSTGDWTGHDGEIAERNGSTWDYEQPLDSWAVLVTEDRGKLYIWEDPNWVSYNILAQGDISSDGSVAFAAHQSMGANNLKDVADPVDPQDAATKQWVESQFITSGFIPLAGTGVGSPVTGDIEVDNSVSAKNILAGSAKVVFNTATLDLEYASQKARISDRGVFVGVGSIDPSSLSAGQSNLLLGSISSQPDISGTNPNNNVLGGVISSQISIDSGSENFFYGANTSPLTIDGSRNKIFANHNGSWSITGSDNSVFGAAGFTGGISGSLNSIFGSASDMLVTGTANFITGLISNLSIDGDSNLVSGSISQSSLDSVSYNNILNGLHSSLTGISISNSIISGSSSISTIDTISNSLVTGNIGNSSLSAVSNSLINIPSGNDLSLVSRSIIHMNTAGAVFSGISDSLIMGNGISASTAGLNQSIVNGNISNSNINGQYLYVLGNAPSVNINGTNSLIVGDFDSSTSSGSYNFIFGGGGVTPSSIGGNNNFVNQSIGSLVSGSNNSLLKGSSTSLVGSSNIIWDNSTALNSLKIDNSVYINTSSNAMDVNNLASVDGLVLVGDVSLNTGLIEVGGNYIFGNTTIDSNLDTSGNTLIGNTSSIDFNSQVNNTYINVSSITPQGSDKVYLPSVTFNHSGFDGTLEASSGLTDNRTYTLPDETGTIALLSDIPGSLVGLWQSVNEPILANYSLNASRTNTSGSLLNNFEVVFNNTYNYTYNSGEQNNITIGNVDSITFSSANNNTLIGGISGLDSLGQGNSIIGNIGGGGTVSNMSNSFILGSMTASGSSSVDGLNLLGKADSFSLTNSVSDITLIGSNSGISVDSQSGLAFINTNGITAQNSDAVAIAIANHTMKTSSAVYVPKIVFAGTSGNEGVLLLDTLSNDRTYTLQNASGTLAFQEEMESNTGSGDPNTVITPRRIGDSYIDLVDNNYWVSKSTSNSSWVLINPISAITDGSGTTASGTSINLGGDLTQNTTIDTNGNNLSLTEGVIGVEQSYGSHVFGGVSPVPGVTAGFGHITTDFSVSSLLLLSDGANDINNSSIRLMWDKTTGSTGFVSVGPTDVSGSASRADIRADYSYLYGDTEVSVLSVGNSTIQGFTMSLTDNNGITVFDSEDSIGARYAQDFSANNTGVNYNPRWIPDLEHVQSLVNTSSSDFTASDNGAVLNVTREVRGSTLKIVGNITNDGTLASKKCLLTDLVPQNFLGKKWLRIKHIWMINNQSPSIGGGINGYLELGEVSSYTSGVAVTDKTLLHIPGQNIGEHRAYSIDDSELGVPTTGGLLDSIEDETYVNNYMFDSPKDITVSGFDLAYITHERAMIDYALSGNDSSRGIDISFIIEADLL